MRRQLTPEQQAKRDARRARFNLSVQDGEDTERTAREMTEAERDKAEADKRQGKLLAPGCAVSVVGGKYHGCILTFVRWESLGPVVLIDRMERTLESTATLTVRPV